jgi:monovalent cation:H+ antiporter-2, CPA2 family
VQETQHSLPFLGETILFLALAGILLPLLQRWRVNQVLGFLAVGTLLGPFGLGLWAGEYTFLSYFTFHELKAVSMLAELGVLFLMFMIGLELSAERLWAMRRWVFGAGTAQVCVSAAIIGGIAWLFGNRLEVAIILGLVLSLSSTAVVMQIMGEQRMLNTPLGQAGFSILMLQDLSVVPLLVLIGLFAKGPADGLLSVLLGTMGKSVLAIVAIYLIGRRLIRPVFQALLRKRQSDVFMALILLSTLGIGALTAATGLSMALGALLAGLLLAETEFKHEVELTVEPFKGLLMGLFFMSVGMSIDIREVMRFPLWLPLSVIGLLLIKATVIAAILRAGKLSWSRSIQGGLLLGQGGEFVFIVIGYAIATRFIDAETGQFIMLVVGLSLFATPFAAKIGDVIAKTWNKPDREHLATLNAALGTMPERKVIIAGFGRVGQMLGQMLAEHHIPYIALENDPVVVAHGRGEGYPLYYGDASRVELLRKVHAEAASAIVLTMDHPASALNAVRAIRRDFPDVPLFVRSRDEKHAVTLKKVGASMVVPETLEASLQLSAAVLHALGVRDDAVTESITAERDRHASAWGTDPGTSGRIKPASHS